MSERDVVGTIDPLPDLLRVACLSAEWQKTPLFSVKKSDGDTKCQWLLFHDKFFAEDTPPHQDKAAEAAAYLVPDLLQAACLSMEWHRYA